MDRGVPKVKYYSLFVDDPDYLDYVNDFQPGDLIYAEGSLKFNPIAEISNANASKILAKKIIRV